MIFGVIEKAIDFGVIGGTVVGILLLLSTKN